MTEPIGARRSAVAYDGAEHTETYDQCINRARADGTEWGGEAGMVGGCISGGYGGLAVGAGIGGPPGAVVGSLGGCIAGGIAGYFAGSTAGASIAETKAKVSCDTPDRTGSPAAASGSAPAAPSPSTPSPAAPTSATAPRPWAPPLALPEGSSAPRAPVSGGATCSDGRTVDDATQCGPHASLTVGDLHSRIWVRAVPTARPPQDRIASLVAVSARAGAMLGAYVAALLLLPVALVVVALRGAPLASFPAVFGRPLLVVLATAAMFGALWFLAYGTLWLLDRRTTLLELDGARPPVRR